MEGCQPQSLQNLEWNKSSFDFIYLLALKPNCFLAKALKEEIHASFTQQLLALELEILK